MAKIKVACFFWDTVYIRDNSRIVVQSELGGSALKGAIQFGDCCTRMRHHTCSFYVILVIYLSSFLPFYTCTMNKVVYNASVVTMVIVIVLH